MELKNFSILQNHKCSLCMGRRLCVHVQNVIMESFGMWKQFVFFFIKKVLLTTIGGGLHMENRLSFHLPQFRICVPRARMEDLNFFGIRMNIFDNLDPEERMVLVATGPSFIPPAWYDVGTSVDPDNHQNTLRSWKVLWTMLKK